MDDEFEERRARVYRERLIQALAELTGEDPDEVVLHALEERMARLTGPASQTERKQKLLNMLESSVWRLGREGHLGDTISRDEEDQILGYGPEGV